MRKELDEKLCADYPEIFRDRHAPMSETCMCWGFDCGDGWYDIVNTLCRTIQDYYDLNHKYNKDLTQPVAGQVKEKFGTLRFYYSGGDHLTDIAVRLAEDESAVTCELCGQPGTLREGGWLRTLCDPCDAARNSKLKDTTIEGWDDGKRDPTPKFVDHPEIYRHDPDCPLYRECTGECACVDGRESS